MIRPELGLLTGIGTAHLGAFGHPDAIGREKLRLFHDLPADRGWLLVPDDPRCLRLAEQQGVRCPLHVFGPGAPNAGPVQVSRRSTTRRLGQVVRLRFADRSRFDIEIHDTSPAQVQNVAAAATAGALLGVPPAEIADALDGFRPPSQRLETWRTPDGVTVINDCYSSDPNSTDAALRALGLYPAGRRKVFVFGGMAGLGAASDEEHRHAGRLASSVGVSQLVAVGALAAPAAEAFEGPTSRVDHPTTALTEIRRTLRHGDVVLVKGPTEQRLDHLAQALVDSSAPTRLVVNLTAVEANLRQIGRHVGPDVGLCAIVKAEAYGGDPVRLSRHLERVGVSALGVAFAEEGVALRQASIALPLLVLSPGRGDAERLVRHRLTPVVHAHYAITELEEAAARLRRPVDLHLKVDTGMGRFGFFPDEVVPVARRIQRSAHLRLQGLMTHFAAAEDPAEDEFTRQQIAAFEEVIAELREAGIEVPVRHAANTAAALRFPEARYDQVRVGLGLYGVAPSPACREVLPLEYAVAAVSRITSIKSFPPGHSIGYGRRYRVGPRPERIAFIPCGYHDAVWRDLYRGGGEVLVRGVRCPIVGTVSMDSAPVNVTGVPEADVGDDVLLFGAWQDQVLPPEEIARRAGTVTHELLSGVGPRVQRIYQEG
jgi:alanine racemase